ncbi:ERF family protein [Azospirillum tabaci]|uniref:ERF family protein n=1 Tax=Azospirillum tabaci TaxID=2752310 RepID=UPI001660DDE1|nr:ERF family protein [Azospirillum tabaci]
MQTSDSIAAISAALAKAQGAIEGAKKDSENPHFRNKYADLSSVWEACRTQLAANGIAVVQAPGTDENGAVTLTTTLAHSSGEWMRSVMACKPAKADAQALGSVITYLRRYSLAAMVGVAPEDDDGEAASGRGGQGKDRDTGMTPSGRQQEPTDGEKAAAETIRMGIEMSETPDELTNFWREHIKHLRELPKPLYEELARVAGDRKKLLTTPAHAAE